MTIPFRQPGPAAARQLNTHDRPIHCGSLSKIDIRRFDYCFAGIRVCRKEFEIFFGHPSVVA